MSFMSHLMIRSVIEIKNFYPLLSIMHFDER